MCNWKNSFRSWQITKNDSWSSAILVYVSPIVSLLMHPPIYSYLSNASPVSVWVIWKRYNTRLRPESIYRFRKTNAFDDLNMHTYLLDCTAAAGAFQVRSEIQLRQQNALDCVVRRHTACGWGVGALSTSDSCVRRQMSETKKDLWLFCDHETFASNLIFINWFQHGHRMIA